MARAPKGTPTSLNLFTLREIFALANVVDNRIRPSQHNGIRRCAAAGYVVVAPAGMMRLTRQGAEAIVADLESSNYPKDSTGDRLLENWRVRVSEIVGGEQ